MKLYYSPGACSLAGHIALHEAELDFQHVKVDLKTKKTESGDDFAEVNPKGYVPALVLDSGELLTENIAVLDWIAHQSIALKPEGALGRTRLLERLAFISTELHKGFGPFFKGGSDEEKTKASEGLAKRFAQLAQTIEGDYLTGDRPSVADFYLFVMLVWAGKNGVEVPERLAALRDRLMERPAVRAAMEHEGLS